MNIPVLKGYLEEAIKSESMVLETLITRVYSKDNEKDIIEYPGGVYYRINNYFIDREDIYRTQGKIQAFRDLLQLVKILSKEATKSELNNHYGLASIEKYLTHDIDTITQLYADTDSIKIDDISRKEG